MNPAREEGMQLALEFAGDEWKNQAFTFLLKYARTHDVFCGEDVSDAHIAAGHPQPRELRAWGALYRKAMNDGVLVRLDNNGWSRRRSSPCPRYTSMTYRAAA
ncbi:MAG TPA: hypothetical protein VGE22_16720 [Solimonas sp.]